MRPIRILYGIDCLARGGTELQLRGLIDRLDRQRFRPHLCTLRSGDDALLPPDCPHLQLDSKSLVSIDGLKNLNRLRGYLKKNRIALVQTFFQDPTLLLGSAAWLAGVPVRLASFRDLGFWRTGAQEHALRLVYRQMTAFIANSQAVRRHFCEHDGLDPGRIAVIPNGLDVSAYTFRPPGMTLRRVGFLGNLNRPVKRPELFVEAAISLHPRFPEVRWEIVGDGHLRAELERRVHEQGLSERISFLGRIDEVAPLIASWDIGVLCSDTEGFSNALLEYMLSGCAPVASAVGGNLEAVREGETGLLFPVGDQAALTESVATLLNDASLTRRIAEAARAEAAERYSWESCLAAHEELYQNLIEDAG